MIRQLQGFERADNKSLFDQMFNHRKLVFHDQKGWDVRLVDEEYEIDEYDRDDTVYLVSLNEHGALTGSIRLLGTHGPHMLNGPFRSMFPDVQFATPLIWEATRFVTLGDKSVQPNQVSRSACEILLGMCRFGLNNGVDQITAVYDAGMARLYRRCGLTHIELGRHRTPEHGTVFVGLWEISRELEASILAATGLERAPSRLDEREAA